MSVSGIAEAIGVGVQSVYRDIRLGKFDPSDLESTVKYAEERRQNGGHTDNSLS